MRVLLALPFVVMAGVASISAKPTETKPLVGCLVEGDSIAVGVGSLLPECRTDAKVGIGSAAFAANRTANFSNDLVVISLGSNDGARDTTAELETVRDRVNARRVVWILPAVGARKSAWIVASMHGDEVLDIWGHTGPDGVHPTTTEYRELAARAKGGEP
jgi:hypothetical protein